MISTEIGKLVRVPLREVWRHEAYFLIREVALFISSQSSSSGIDTLVVSSGRNDRLQLFQWSDINTRCPGLVQIAGGAPEPALSAASG